MTSFFDLSTPVEFWPRQCNAVIEMQCVWLDNADEECGKDVPSRRVGKGEEFMVSICAYRLVICAS